MAINFAVDPGYSDSDLKSTTVVLGKVFTDHVPWVNTVIAAKAAGATFVQDICDYHQLNDDSFYQILLGLADRITVSSMYLKEAVEKRHVNGKKPVVHYIPDAPELAKGTINTNPLGKIPHLLWYGQAKNLTELAKIKLPLCTLQLVTNLPRQLAKKEVNLCQTVWSVEAVQNALQACDFVVVPADTSSPDGLAKSGNRILEALWAGRPVLASRVPEYIYLKECYNLHGLWLMDENTTKEQLSEILYDLGQFPIDNDQKQIEENLTINHTVKLWADAFRL